MLLELGMAWHWGSRPSVPKQEAGSAVLGPTAPNRLELSGHHLRGGTQSPTLLPREVLTLKPE